MRTRGKEGMGERRGRRHEEEEGEEEGTSSSGEMDERVFTWPVFLFIESFVARLGTQCCFVSFGEKVNGLLYFLLTW